MEEKLIQTHKKAAGILCKIKEEFKEFISESDVVSENHARRFVKSRFKLYNIRTDKDSPIVAFGKNTSQVHYFPGSRSDVLKKEDIILLDMWGHLPNGVFADITWMFYFGKNPHHDMIESFNAIRGARDVMISFVRDRFQDKQPPSSNEADAVVRDYLNEKKQGAYFLHSTGHSMTQRLVHGWKSDKGITPRNPSKIKRMMPYTVEPGLYFAHLDEPFGVRTEMDFYIDKKGEVQITSDVQKELDFILPKGQKRLENFK